MTNKYLLTGLALVVGLVLGFVAGVLGNQLDEDLGGSRVNYNAMFQVGDFHSGQAGVKVISGGEVVGPLNLPSGNEATLAGAITLSGDNCATDSWNPGEVSSSTAPDKLDIAHSGAELGDIVIASFDSATTTDLWRVEAKVTGESTSTIYIHGNDTAVNLSEATARVCKFK